jgi:hypothetical protein
VALHIDWDLVWRVERDVCFMYHLQATEPRPAVDGDWDYSSLFHLPYWEVLSSELPAMDQEEARFLSEGCLVMIFAMAVDLIDGSGNALSPYLAECRIAVNGCRINHSVNAELVDAVSVALDRAQRGQHADDDFLRISVWVKRSVIEPYFQRMTRTIVTSVRPDRT